MQFVEEVTNCLGADAASRERGYLRLGQIASALPKPAAGEFAWAILLAA